MLHGLDDNRYLQPPSDNICHRTSARSLSSVALQSFLKSSIQFFNGSKVMNLFVNTVDGWFESHENYVFYGNILVVGRDDNYF